MHSLEHEGMTRNTRVFNRCFPLKSDKIVGEDKEHCYLTFTFSRTDPIETEGELLFFFAFLSRSLRCSSGIQRSKSLIAITHEEDERMTLTCCFPIECA